MILYFEDMKTTDAKEKKQFRELSDEELEKVTGGERKHSLDLDTTCSGSIPPECKNKTMDEYGCLICISY